MWAVMPLEFERRSNVYTRVTAAYLSWSPRTVVALAAVLFAVIATVDFLIPTISLDFLYVIPIVFAGGFLSRTQILILSAASSALRELFAPEPLDSSRPVRAVFTFGAFIASGLFVGELSRNRRLGIAYIRELEEQVTLRKEAQEQLAVLIDTSPAAILIVDDAGKVLLANESAETMLGFAGGKLIGERIHSYLPAIETVPVGEGRRSLRSNLECRGHRRNGSVFLAQVWFSTYLTAHGPRIAAIVLDASEGLRDREGAGLQSLMRMSRVLVGAVSHSVRNLCAASQVSYANLARLPELKNNEDLMALGTLIRGLDSLARTQLGQAPEHPATAVDLNTVLDELRVVIEPTFEEAGIELGWHVEEQLPPVIGEHYGLLHGFLNLTQNSERELGSARVKRLDVRAHRNASGVDVSFTDTAGGVSQPDLLFQPFNPGAKGTGLGLYVSRAIVRSFDGNLNYEPVPGGSRFRVELRTAHNLVGHANDVDG
jgi:PAS domain S-box-containing protein